MAKDNKGKNGASTQAGAPGSGGGLGVWGLAGVVVSSMIGGGIYSLPQNMAAGASAGAVLLAWLITGIGVYFLANTFRILSVVKPDLSAGIYMYSREGFGPYAGFTIGWSYWLCQVCGNVGYAVIAMDALNYFFPPYFAGGNGIYSIIGGSLLIWGFNALVLRGIQQALPEKYTISINNCIKALVTYSETVGAFAAFSLANSSGNVPFSAAACGICAVTIVHASQLVNTEINSPLFII